MTISVAHCRLSSDGKVIIHCYCSSNPYVLCSMVVDYACSVLPIVGRPATIK